MPLRVFSMVLLSLATLGVPAGAVDASGDEPLNTPPPTEFNEFYPDERPLSDCLSSLPKPDCGSEARGGWRQLTILGVVVIALGFIAWRIVRSASKARQPADERHDESATPGTRPTRIDGQPPG